MKYRLAQTDCVAITHMIDPALYAGIHRFVRYLATGTGVDKSTQFAPEVYSFSAFEATMVGVDDEAEEGDAFGHRSRVDAGVDSEAQAGATFDDGPMPIPQHALVVAETDKIIHETHIGRAAQFPFDEVIEGIQIAVGPELAGEVANWQPPGPVDGKEIVAGEVDAVVLLAQQPFTTAQYLIDQPQHLVIVDLASQDGSEHGVVDSGKKLLNIAL